MQPPSKRARRIVVPLALVLLVVGIVAVMVSRPAKTRSSDAAVETATSQDGSSVPIEQQASANGEGESGSTPGAPPTITNITPVAAGVADLLDGLRAVAPEFGERGPNANLRSIGALDPQSDVTMRMDFATAGAGIERIVMNHHWQTWQARKQAEAHRAAVAAGKPSPPPMPSDDLRFQIVHAREFVTVSSREGRAVAVSIPSMSALELVINGTSVSLFDYTYGENDERVYVWSQLPVEFEPGTMDDMAVAFVTDVRNAHGTVVVHVRREYVLGPTGDVTLKQFVENRTNQPLQIEWRQYGPSDLDPDRSQYMDNRRFRFGWLSANAPDYPNGYVFADDDHLLERSSIIKRWESDPADDRLWPNERSRERNQEIAWFATTSRYFAVAVHPVWEAETSQSKSLRAVVDRVLFTVASDTSNQQAVFTYLYSPVRTVAPSDVARFDMGIYAGPMDRLVLGENEPYASLHMDGLIIYMMSTFCAFCTFQWLAHILMWLLSLFHSIIFDWGVAIILLVMIVRALLHPILKKSQIGMQRFSRQMQKIQPELQKLQKKYASDPKRMQQEQIRLWREHGVSPLGCLNMLPLFLQMPIWIALYAMLYFAFDLRQQPAFYGIFQVFWDWPFLADLSASDHFFGEFATPLKFSLLCIPVNITGLNILPFLMGFIFFIQQKYMTPPPSPTMSKEMLQQQKIMKVMMVVMFPLMLYSAPSGLTLYILTSSMIGIIESRWIRAHIKELDLDAPARKVVVNEKQKKPRGAIARAYARAMEAAEERRRQKNEPPPPRFKKRK